MSATFPEISRSLVQLTDENRLVRKEALKKIKRDILELKACASENESLLVTVANHLPNSLHDSVEFNRELALETLECLMNQMSELSSLLPSLIPVLVQRLGQKEITEPSEELRYSTLKLVHRLTNVADLAPFVDDILIILQRTLLDPFHEVKKLSCQIAIKLATKKYHRFYQSSEIILNSLLSNLTHQHSKVRLETVNALGTVLMYSQGKLVESVLTPLTQRLFDSAPTVRRAVIEIVGTWLLDLPDRYSYQTRLLPLLLSGFTDDSDEIQDFTVALWHDIGRIKFRNNLSKLLGLKFEKENEEQLKDKLDFDKGPPQHYPLGCKRPTLGCRELVYRSASRILPALCKDLSDWQETTRSKAASLLPLLILHLEDSVTQHAQHLLTGIASGLADTISRIAPATGSIALLHLLHSIPFRDESLSEEELTVTDLNHMSLVPKLPPPFISNSGEITEAVKVLSQLLLSAQLLGCLLSAKFWWHLIEPCLKRCTESSAPCSLAGHLYLLAGLLNGSSLNELINFNNNSINDTTESNYFNLLIHQILIYLHQNDILSVLSFSTKSALYECVLTYLKHIEMSILISCKYNSLTISHSNTNELINNESNNLHSNNHIKNVYKSAQLLLSDFDLRSWLFQIILGLSGVWADNNLSSTDFAQTLIRLTEDSLRKLAACERDCSICLSSDNLDIQNKLIVYDNRDSKPSLHLASLNDINEAVSKYIPPLLERLNGDLSESGSWHPKSVGLALITRCLFIAGPALLINPNKVNPNSTNITNMECLRMVLDILEKGCRLNCAPVITNESDKSPGGTDPLTLASEAELRLRGLMILTRLTDNGPIRSTLSSPTYISHCLNKLVLPVCVWRAGRTSEAMRKAAITCLVALLGAATSIYDFNEAIVDTRTKSELMLDIWLCEHVDCVRELLGVKTMELNLKILNEPHHESNRTSSLVDLSSSSLSLLLVRLGSLLDDDLDVTRRMACLCLTLLFNGLLLPSMNDAIKQNKDENSNNLSSFLNSSTWLQTQEQIDNNVNDLIPYCPLPGSFGDQVYRFYPNLIKRLNDSKDQVRLLISETINSWIRLLIPMLTSNPSTGDGDNQQNQSINTDNVLLNPVHTAIIDDILNSVIIHLDDSSSIIRGAIARIIARLGKIAPLQVEKCLIKSSQCHRSSHLCDQLLELLHMNKSNN